AGHGNGLKSLPQVKQTLDQLQLDYDLVLTERSGQGIDLARQAAKDGYDVVVAAGGDGTINEVVNGLMAVKLAGARPPILGVLPIGRGNDFAYSVGIPVEVEPACRALANANHHPVDIGKVTGGKVPQGRYFCNCVGIGFDAIVTIEVAKMPRLGGFAGFLIAVLKTMFLYNHAPLADIDFGGQTISQRSLLISIMNGKRLGGGGFVTAPDSLPDDGLLDLCIAEQMSIWAILRIIPLFMKGTQASQKTIKTGRTAQVTVTAHDGPLPAHTDGEIICTEDKRLTVELLPRQLEIIR
ncbi:MAG TPA: diacylglycerol kinase family protein, partial [Longilinea sp.]|nr:diacylglycerol kinase family protein [Longilinea sp.]